MRAGLSLNSAGFQTSTVERAAKPTQLPDDGR